MTVQATTSRSAVQQPARAPGADTATPAPAPSSTAPVITADDLVGLSPDAYAALARSFREKGNQDLADRYTLAAVKAAQTGSDALGYATQRYGDKADANPYANQMRPGDAPYVASPDTQRQAFDLAASKFTSFDEAFRALQSYPAQTPDAETSVIRRTVDLAKDSDMVARNMDVFKSMGSQDAIAYAEAAVKTKPKISFWARFWRNVNESVNQL